MDFKELAERTIDSVIRGFDPEEPGSYEHWDFELERVEDSLRRSGSGVDLLLLSSVCAERIRIAFEAGRPDLLSERSAYFLQEFPTTMPSFSLVAALRFSALHALGAHEKEIREGLQIATDPEIQGTEFIHLMAGLAKRHPDFLPADEDLWQKLKRSIEDLRAQGYDTLPGPVGSPEQLGEVASRVAAELRRVHRERGEALLSGP